MGGRRDRVGVKSKTKGMVDGGVQVTLLTLKPRQRCPRQGGYAGAADTVNRRFPMALDPCRWILVNV